MITAAVIVVVLAILLYRPRQEGNLVGPAAELASWHWEQQGKASGGVTIDGDAVKVQVLAVDGVSYHLQLFQQKAVLYNGRTYRVRFKAKADRPYTLKVAAGINHPDYHEMGMAQEVSMTSDWQPYEFTFRAEGADGQRNKIPSFVCAYALGTFWVKDLTVEAI
jgi:hypothetical protein